VNRRATQKRKPEQVWVAVEPLHRRAAHARPIRFLGAALEDSAEAGLPDIAVTPGQGKLLYLMAKMQGCQKDSRNRYARRIQQIWLAGARCPPMVCWLTLEAEREPLLR